MKLFTRSSILKSITVEVTSPRILESPDLERDYRKFAKPQGVPLEFPMLSAPGEGRAAESAGTQSESGNHIQEESNNVFVEAKRQAEQVLAEARNQAAEIIRNAQTESIALRKTIEEQVRQEVTPLAHAEGYENGLREAKEEAELIRKQSRLFLEMAKKVLQDEFHKVDTELVQLCLKISERVIHSTLQAEPERLLNIIRNLSLLPREKEGIKIHLSGKDWEWYKTIPAEDKPLYPVIVDETLKAGDTFLECAEGVFDARVNSQLEKIEQYLYEELDHGRLDSLSP
ncbi:MAG: hypothetical protein AWM53_00562 [Candidatus Dichloromethanomonas elyunquensis]|nr:MAG: hypothetical protein AWM53_00562 [Candidatus Dichloromethanomonas elyunquensis]